MGNFAFHKYKERKQRIILEQETTSVFKPFTIGDKQPPVLKITSASGNDYQFNNLFLTIIHLRNKSDKDFDSFEVTFSTPKDYEFIHITETTTGIQHIVTKDPLLDFSARGTSVKVTLTPFNRKDKYSLKAYSTSLKSNDLPILGYDSRHPVEFEESGKESVLKLTTVASATFGGILATGFAAALLSSSILGRDKDLNETTSRTKERKIEVLDSLFNDSKNEISRLKGSLYEIEAALNYRDSVEGKNK